MLTKKFPGLDADPQEYEDLFGPPQEIRGLDRLIGEGRIELPWESRDPLEILLAGQVDAVVQGVDYVEPDFVDDSFLSFDFVVWEADLEDMRARRDAREQSAKLSEIYWMYHR